MDRYARIIDGQDHFKSAGLGFNHIITSVHLGGRGKGRPPQKTMVAFAQMPVVTIFSIPGTRLTNKKNKGHVMPRYRVGKRGIDSHLCFPPPKQKVHLPNKISHETEKLLVSKNCWFRKICPFLFEDIFRFHLSFRWNFHPKISNISTTKTSPSITPANGSGRSSPKSVCLQFNVVK